MNPATGINGMQTIIIILIVAIVGFIGLQIYNKNKGK